MNEAAVTEKTVEAAPVVDPAVAALQKEIADLKEASAEKDRATQFWHEKATKGEPAKPKASDEEPEVDILDTLTTKGVKGLTELLAKAGYVKADEVDKRVDAKASAVIKQQQLYEQYPDLKDKKSDFFKSAAMNYGNLVKAGTSEAVALEMSAAMTELQFLREGKLKTPAEQKAEKEVERKKRVAAQAGEGTGRIPAREEEENDELTPEQTRIVSSMLVGSPGKDGKPMDLAAATEAYKARAKAGVAMKGIR